MSRSQPALPYRQGVRATAAALSALLVTLVVGAVAPTTALAAGTSGYCTTETGVTVVVDFRAFGGNIVVRCAPGPGGRGYTGLEAIQGAGFTVQGTKQYGLQFICKIQDRPRSQECLTTPPTDAYWGYWYAANGGTWTYSDLGASSHTTIAGGFEGWAFSTGSRTPPGIKPVRPRVPTPTTTAPTTTAPTRTAPTRTAPTRTAPTRSPPPASRTPSPTSTSPEAKSGTKTAPVTTQPVAPPASRTPTARPPTATPPPTTGPTNPTSASPSGRPRKATGTTRGAGTAKTPARTGERSKTGDRPGATSAEDTGSDRVANSERVTGELPESSRDDDTAGGSPTATLVVFAILTALGLGAGLTAWRRSHRG